MIKIYRIKDTNTGLFYSSGKYSYSDFKMTKRGRIYTQIGFLKNSMNLQKGSIFVQNNPDLFPAKNHKISMFIDNARNPAYNQAQQEETKVIRACTKWFPDTWVVIDETDTIIGTLNEIMK